ncbi:hypothetical protein C8J57DRAFT_134452 [Mycena rebaudengoi]|nr:hypothetical protein C8J57DRAFT_134452 [Mycena rebaudengoi]
MTRSASLFSFFIGGILCSCCLIPASGPRRGLPARTSPLSVHASIRPRWLRTGVCHNTPYILSHLTHASVSLELADALPPQISLPVLLRNRPRPSSSKVVVVVVTIAASSSSSVETSSTPCHSAALWIAIPSSSGLASRSSGARTRDLPERELTAFGDELRGPGTGLWARRWRRM